MKKILLGVLASGSGSNFAAIAQSFCVSSEVRNAIEQKLSQPEIDLSVGATDFPEHPTVEPEISVLIYNNSQAYAAQRAKDFGIPAVLLDHRQYASRAELDRAIAAVLQTHKVDLVVMAGWMRVVTQVLLDAFPKRVLNIHPSLLPSFPGIRAVEQALDYGVKITGCTVHVVSLEVDRGPILAQAAVAILPVDTVTSLQAKIQVLEHHIYPRAIAAYCETLNRETLEPRI